MVWAEFHFNKKEDLKSDKDINDVTDGVSKLNCSDSSNQKKK